MAVKVDVKDMCVATFLLSCQSFYTNAENINITQDIKTVICKTQLEFNEIEQELLLNYNSSTKIWN